MCTRSAHAAVSKVCADAVLKKVLNVRRKKAGEFLKDVCAINGASSVRGIPRIYRVYPVNLFSIY